MSRRRYDGRNGRDRYYAGRRDGGGDSGGNCLVLLILALIAMPFVGLYLILKKDGDEGTKVIGWILLVLGIILWVYLAMQSGK